MITASVIVVYLHLSNGLYWDYLIHEICLAKIDIDRGLDFLIEIGYIGDEKVSNKRTKTSIFFLL